MSASVVVRRLPSVPVRTSSDTWASIVALLSTPGSAAETELRSASGVISMLIADEVTSQVPIVVVPSVGSRVRIYTLHGTDAVDHDGGEQPLAACPTEGHDWLISVPSSSAEIDWVRKQLGSLKHFAVRDLTEGIEVDAEPEDTRGMVVDPRWMEE